MSFDPARPSARSRHRSAQRLTAAGAVVALVTGLVTMEALAEEEEPAPAEQGEAVPVRGATAGEADLLLADADEGLAGALGDALDARADLVATEPEPEPEPEPDPEPEPAASGTVDEATWDRLAQCESGGNWSINTGNGFYGGLQFEIDSWRWVGGSGYPHEASRAEQIRRAEILLQRQGWEAWPACSRQLGLR